MKSIFKPLDQYWMTLISIITNHASQGVRTTLRCGDFYSDLEIEFEDNSKLIINFGMYLQDDKEYLIVTEHLGYFVIDSEVIEKITVKDSGDEISEVATCFNRKLSEIFELESLNSLANLKGRAIYE